MMGINNAAVKLKNISGVLYSNLMSLTNTISNDSDEVNGLDDTTGDSLITLISESGEKYDVHPDVARMSTYISNILDNDTTVTELKLEQISSKVLQKIIQWCEYHNKTPMESIPKPLKSKVLSESVKDKWDCDFMELEHADVFELLVSANFLINIPLLELCCAKFATFIIDKTPEEIRRDLDIQGDYTPEEEAEVRKEFADYLDGEPTTTN